MRVVGAPQGGSLGSKFGALGSLGSKAPLSPKAQEKPQTTQVRVTMPGLALRGAPNFQMQDARARCKIPEKEPNFRVAEEFHSRSETVNEVPMDTTLIIMVLMIFVSRTRPP